MLDLVWWFFCMSGKLLAASITIKKKIINENHVFSGGIV